MMEGDARESSMMGPARGEMLIKENGHGIFWRNREVKRPVTVLPSFAKELARLPGVQRAGGAGGKCVHFLFTPEKHAGVFFSLRHDCFTTHTRRARTCAGWNRFSGSKSPSAFFGRWQAALRRRHLCRAGFRERRFRGGAAHHEHICHSHDASPASWARPVA